MPQRSLTDHSLPVQMSRLPPGTAFVDDDEARLSQARLARLIAELETKARQLREHEARLAHMYGPAAFHNGIGAVTEVAHMYPAYWSARGPWP